ncbi:Maf family protein [Heliophilum fasciatum]|uniref:dTTP/UTP pyrophosphatase n=1 Tax=Heliophilum fasciatum TaxID=35700 RepID=A0A4R2S758_9FIRM|nr:Maf family protein [Heliophilum fasciatum]MCW2277142.1 septum formation protein [Heliophilum fasciatum]TCP68221.1 septum formation protein [Heliophilum fasciatum]
MHLILASASPRRRQLLTDLHLSFTIVPSNFVEAGVDHLPPREQAIALAEGKANEVARRTGEGLILGADTIVVHEGTVLGKPRDADDAFRTLRRLSGQSHQVITGLALIEVHDGQPVATVTGAETTMVTFRQLDEADIAAYVATGDPLDKAGAYGIQGLAALLVERIDGDYFNVVGLPLVALDRLMRRWQISLLQQGAAREQSQRATLT